MKIIFVHSTLPEDQYRVHVRCHNPASALQASGRHTIHLLPLEEFIHNSPAAVEVCAAADVIVVHRYLFENTLAAVARWRARGKKLLVDIDLSVEHLEPDREGYSFWQKGILPPPYQNGSRPVYPPPAEQLKWLFKMVDGILVPTPQLARDYFAFGRVQILADYLNINEFLVVPPQKRDDRLWLGLNFSGQAFSSLKLSGVLEGVEQVFQQSERLGLLLVGADSSAAHWLNRLPAERVEVVPALSVEGLPAVLSKADIGLLPAFGEFAARQSPLPALEYMAMKIPWIASNQPGFQGLAEYGHLVENSAAEWTRAILEMADHLDSARRRAAGSPYLYALGQDAAENIEKIERTFRVFEEAG
ncbi:MAG: glycosyltransferase [Chloroflexota bacterium]